MDIITRLEEAELLAGVEDGAPDLVAAQGQVDDGQGDRAGGRLRLRQLVGREDEALRERRVDGGCVEHLLHRRIRGGETAG